jgi:hypothetical protein
MMAKKLRAVQGKQAHRAITVPALLSLILRLFLTRALHNGPFYLASSAPRPARRRFAPLLLATFCRKHFPERFLLLPLGTP